MPEPKVKPENTQKKTFEKDGKCPKCGCRTMAHHSGLQSKCMWCSWLVPKNWKIP